MNDIDLGSEFKDVPDTLLVQKAVMHSKHILSTEAMNRDDLDSPSPACCER